jgi:hypothetical protein
MFMMKGSSQGRTIERNKPHRAVFKFHVVAFVYGNSPPARKRNNVFDVPRERLYEEGSIP